MGWGRLRRPDVVAVAVVWLSFSPRFVVEPAAHFVQHDAADLVTRTISELARAFTIQVIVRLVLFFARIVSGASMTIE